MTLPVLQDASDRLTDAIFFGSRFGSGGGVPSSRVIATGFGLSGGGDLTTNRTHKVNDVVNGYNVLNHGAVADGVTDNTAVYDAIFALADSGVLVFPPGEFAGAINLPDTNTGGGVPKNWHVMGSGIYSTILLPAVADTPIIQKANRSTGIIEGATFSGFAVKGGAGGSTGPAIDLVGMRACAFSHIASLPGTGAVNFSSLFHLSVAQLTGCYDNTISHVLVSAGTLGLGADGAPATIVLFDYKKDDGSTFTGNGTANNNHFEHFFVFSNIGISAVFNIADSSNTTIEDCFLEDLHDPVPAWVVLGGYSIIRDSHFECDVLGGLPDLMDTSGAVGCAFLGNDFSGLTTFTLANTSQDNLLAYNIFYAGTFGDTLIVDNGTNNIIWNAGKVVSGTVQTQHIGSYGDAPSVSSTNLGAGGTATLLTGSNDTDGVINLNFGTTVPDFKGIITLTFATAYANPPMVMVCPAQGTAGGGSAEWSSSSGEVIQVLSLAESAVTIRWANGITPPDNSRFRIHYMVKGLPN